MLVHQHILLHLSKPELRREGGETRMCRTAHSAQRRAAREGGGLRLCPLLSPLNPRPIPTACPHLASISVG